MGVIGVEPSDVSERRVDSLMADLRVMRIVKVRAVMAQAPRLDAKRGPASATERKKKKKKQSQAAEAAS